MVCNWLKRLDSGLAVIQDPDPGRNDEKRYFGTFYETVNIENSKKKQVIKYSIFNRKYSIKRWHAFLS